LKVFTTQILFMMAAVFFLMKGGVGILVGAWKLLLPIVFLGGAFYFMRKAFAVGSLPKGGSDPHRVRQPDAQTSSPRTHSNVIEICPHCLSEVGSCPKCKKRKFF